jgi:hypothetical protein
MGATFQLNNGETDEPLEDGGCWCCGEEIDEEGECPNGCCDEECPDCEEEVCCACLEEEGEESDADEAEDEGE